jgi:hypothetical protein
MLVGLAAAVFGRLLGPTTPVEIVSDGGRLEVTAAGSRLTADVAPVEVRRLVVSASDSIDPPGGGRLTVETADGHRREWRLPSRFRFTGPGVEPVGDWWIDTRARTGEVWAADLDVSGPFALETVLTGRPLQAVSFRFEGRPELAVEIRRGLINNDLAVRTADGRAVAVTSLDPDPVRDLAAALSTLLSGVAGASALIALVALAARAVRRERVPAGPATRSWWPAPATTALVIGGLVVSLWTASHILERLPHLPDEVVHHIQSSWLLDGRVSQPAVGWQDGLDVPHTYVVEGRWLAQYPFVWPAMLAPAAAVGLEWLIPPLLGGLTIWLVWGLGRELYGPRVAAVAAALVTVSPLLRVLAASTLSHAAETCLLVGAAWAAARGLASGGRGPLLVAGLLLGLAVGVRPLPTLVSVVAFALIAATIAAREGIGGRTLSGLGWTALGLLAGAAPTLLVNVAVTGRPLRFAYEYAGRPMYGLSNLGFGVQNLDAVLAHLPPQLFGWGWGWMDPWLVTALPLALPFVVVLLGRTRPADRALLLVVGLLIASLAGTHGHGLHGYGPRYLAEAVPFLALVAARGAIELARVAPGRPHGGRAVAPALVTVAVVGGLTMVAAVQMPARLALYRGYNHVGTELLAALDAADVRRGVVVFTRDDWRDWARAAPRLGPDPDAPVLFARFTGVGEPLCRAAGDRPWWRWNGARLTPWPDPPCDRGGPR